MLYFEILAIGLQTLMNGLLALSELAIVSSRKSRLAHLANQGCHGARAALRLIDDPIRVIMTPRSKIVWLDVKSDRTTILEIVESHRFSRLPICDGTVDHPLGFIHTKNLLPDAPMHCVAPMLPLPP